ncbi:MAG TPA: DDE-type integrase/transposase/recombinase, partial [Cerasibacillus sp.]|uniref:DDE-type integrase/transposase/recombinase n=1 Tax=Cerasibacillus sp. TaxID=2498711 RepID=UPI002F42BBC3
ILNRAFDYQTELSVVDSDLTYVRVNGKWNYVYLFVDLFNREIIGHSVGENKTAELVYKALSRPLHLIEMFHTDRGSDVQGREN